jgi:hypothetical protein
MLPRSFRLRLRRWRRKRKLLTTSRGLFDRSLAMTKAKMIAVAAVLAALFAVPASGVASPALEKLAQAMLPPTGMDDAAHPMPMPARMQRRFPQAVRVGDLIGLPVLDLDASTLGYVRAVTRNAQDKIALIVSYSRWFGWLGWFAHPVAVPIEALGIEGRQLVSLDLPPSEYAAAPVWRGGAGTPLSADTEIRIALARN